MTCLGSKYTAITAYTPMPHKAPLKAERAAQSPMPTMAEMKNKKNIRQENLKLPKKEVGRNSRKR